MFYIEENDKPTFLERILTKIKIENNRIIIPIEKELTEKKQEKLAHKTIKLLNIKLAGHYRYYGITDNTKSIQSFYEITAKMLFKVLNRRSQKNKYSYRKYYDKVQKQITRPRIYVDIVKNE